MTVHVHNSQIAREIIQSRESADSGHRDEVWEGVYQVMSDPNNEHQEFAAQLAAILVCMIAFPKLGRVLLGGNISDREGNWLGNYRIPDVAVYLNDTRAVDRGTHWLGGPDFLIEIVSPDDLSHEKLPFYAKVGTREVLFVNRDPWTLELFRLQGDKLALAGVSKPDDSNVLASEGVPLSFRFIAGSPRPLIEIKALQNDQIWNI